MGAQGVLLLDFSSGALQSPQIHKILETYRQHGAPVHHVSAADLSATQWVHHVSRIATDNNINLVLLFPHADPNRSTAAILRVLRQTLPHAHLLVATQNGATPDFLDEFRKANLHSFLIPPFFSSPLCYLHNGEKESDYQRRKQHYRATKTWTRSQNIVGRSPIFLCEIEKIPTIAECEANVLITGATGTGKELIARAIHLLGARSLKPFVPVNCGAIPSELVERELFGHRKGAFTGAIESRHGLLFEAEGGTVFLDEVDCLPQMVQAKLLRFLQEKEYRVVGTSQLRKADVRVIAASNHDLGLAMTDSSFRTDLYYRLNVISIHLPLLKERMEDIPLLAEHFIKKYSVSLGKDITGLSKEAINKLVHYDWPGNIRELENVIESAIVFASTSQLTASELRLPKESNDDAAISFREAKARVVADFERTYIERLLVVHGGNISSAARAARKNRRAFWELMRKHSIDIHSIRQLKRS